MTVGPALSSLLLTVVCSQAMAVSNQPQDRLDKRARDVSTVPTIVSFNNMTIETEQILFGLKKQLGLGSISGSPVAIYRKDLPSNYIAYWQIEFDHSEYVVISAGPQTGDRKFIHQGRLPRPTSYLDDVAGQHGNTCTRYYMLSPMGEMMCENEAGEIVATNIASEVLVNMTSTNPYTTVVEQFITSRLCDNRVQWARHAVSVRGTGEWRDEEVVTEEELGDTDLDDDVPTDLDLEAADDDPDVDPDDMGTATEDAFQETEVEVGEKILVALGQRDMLGGVYVRYAGSRDTANVTVEGQAQLCHALGVCSSNVSTGRVDPSNFKLDPETGLSYLELILAENARKLFPDSDLDFAVEIHRTNHQVVIRRYALLREAERQKRFKEYEPWSSFTQYSIPSESLFPDYRQHRAGRCWVGCGPVAWAMVFGYLDRRSHLTSSFGTGSQGLYRSGSDGTTGSNSQVAPSFTDSRMQNYTEELNDILGTWCIFSSGATLMRRMTRVQGFYQARQTTGSPRVIKDGSWLTWLGVYRESIASWTRARLREGWPVIVGTKEGWFTGWHYPVATMYRTRRRRWRRCFRVFRRKICFGWRTETDNDMYLHMGWGGYKDGWYTMKSFYSVAARY